MASDLNKIKFDFPGYVIHLKSLTNRLPLIEDIKTVTDISLNIFNAFDGSEWWRTMPLQHPWRFDKITQGMVGCTQSHLAVLDSIQNQPMDAMYLFEDDAVFVKPIKDLNVYLDNIEKSGLEWDIILLGANEYVVSEPIEGHQDICSVKRFWGAHAMLIKRAIIPQLRNVFDASIANGIFLPPDWLYNDAIKVGIKVLGPTIPKEFVIQAPGYVSALTGKILC